MTTLSQARGRSAIRYGRWILGIAALVFLLSLYRTASKRLPGLLPSAVPHVAKYDPTPAQISAIDSIKSSFESMHHVPDPVYSNPFLTASQERRYSHLKTPMLNGKPATYMLTTVIRQISSQLPDLINTIYVLVTFIGSAHITISILEGPSDDGTSEILTKVLIPLLHSLGVPPSQIFIQTESPKIDFDKVNRIETLANLRNQALQPLWKEDLNVKSIVFFNDVYLKAGDVLEVLHQHIMSGAGISTGWDWMERVPQYFYDVWVARTMEGDLFYPIDYTWWSPSDNLFSTSPSTLKAFKRLEPFQVYSSWNGLAVLDPKPFLPPYNIRFRRGKQGECAASECSLIAADFWKVGFGRVQVIPSVQLAYSRDVAVQTATLLEEQKSVAGWIDGVPPRRSEKSVKFRVKPPSKVRCHPWKAATGLSENVWETTEWVDP